MLNMQNIFIRNKIFFIISAERRKTWTGTDNSYQDSENDYKDWAVTKKISCGNAKPRESQMSSNSLSNITEERYV